MKRLKILGIASEEYPGGRLDSFRFELPTKSPHHSNLIPLFLKLDFPEEEVLKKLDVILQEADYIFIYGNPKIKAHLIVEGENLLLKFDTSLPREKINEAVEKYFEFPD